MIYRFIILTVLLLSLAACAPVMMTGKVTSEKGTDLGPVEMTANKRPELEAYTIKAQLPDETVFSGDISYHERSVTMYSHDGVSMKCNFELQDQLKEFEGGGKGSCTTSDGQKLTVKF
ncbi:hypothetical protein [Maridesulfovibrio sp.]|uniref:hypothetical protein n=1 Tax=Maridesulfovibrio sp. TaxID=2795000 RepID=UPI002A189994|nr:hypothetical protein [Maridesulfovibrio sp.]